MVQPLLVSISALTLATETVRSILKIDDVVSNLQFYCYLILQNDFWLKSFICVSGEHPIGRSSEDMKSVRSVRDQKTFAICLLRFPL